MKKILFNLGLIAFIFAYFTIPIIAAEEDTEQIRLEQVQQKYENGKEKADRLANEMYQELRDAGNGLNRSIAPIVTDYIWIPILLGLGLIIFGRKYPKRKRDGVVMIILSFLLVFILNIWPILRAKIFT